MGKQKINPMEKNTYNILQRKNRFLKQKCSSSVAKKFVYYIYHTSFNDSGKNRQIKNNILWASQQKIIKKLIFRVIDLT